jgi:hypothetical protein
LNATILLTVTLISLGGVQARLTEPVGELLQVGDTGELFYELRIGNEIKIIEAGIVEVTESTALHTLVEVAPGTEIKAGYQARFEVPIARLSPPDVARLIAKSAELAPSGEAPPSAVGETAAGTEEPPALDGPVLGVLETWRSAWQRQDVASYLACYSSGFEPEDGSSLEAWREIRARRLSAPAFIEIELVGIEVEPMASGEVRLTFDQVYRSDGFSDTVRKELVMERAEDGWRIHRERSLL